MQTAPTEALKQSVEPKVGLSSELPLLTCLTLFSALALFWKLGTGSLMDWDEAIYAQISKELVQGRDWLTLQWAHQPWFEKPPLLMWATAVSYHLFGVSEFSARAASALSGIGLILVTYSIARLTYGKSIAFFSGLILLTCYEFLHYARLGTTDVMFCLFVYLAIYGYMRVRLRGEKWWYLVCVAAGLAVMVKGAAALIIPAAIALELALDKRLVATLRSRYLWLGCLLAIAVVAPWHIMMYLLHGRDFLEEYVGYHVIARAATSLPRHSHGFLYYPKLFIRFFFPWSLLAPFAIAISIREINRGESRSRILLLLTALTFGLYSVAKTKITWYILPVYPAIAVLVGALLDWVRNAYPRFRYGVFLIFGIAICFVGALLLEPERFLRVRELLDWDPLYHKLDYPIAELARLDGSNSTAGRDPLILCSDYETPPLNAPLFYSDRPVQQAFVAHKPFGPGAARYFAAQKLSDLVGAEKKRIILRKELMGAVVSDYEVDQLATADSLVYAMIKRKPLRYPQTHASETSVFLRSPPEKSEFIAKVDDSGVFKLLGDDHVIRVTDYRAEVMFDEQNDTNSSVKLVIPAASLKVVDPKLPDSKRAKVQERMEGPEVLDVAGFPEIAFQSREIKRVADGRYRVEGDLEIRGTLRPIIMDVSMIREASVYHARGETRISQIDFWIQPIAVLGGMLKVKDEMKVVFDLALAPVRP
jgi:polyisoprenoid-binding protein YceI